MTAESLIACQPCTTVPAATDVALADHLSSGHVGPGWEVVRVPETLARQAVARLDRLSSDLVGAVCAIGGWWSFFVPEGSNDPQWPEPAAYLASGAAVTLPPASWERNAAARGARWVRRCHQGRVFTAPLFLYLAVTAPAGTSLPEGLFQRAAIGASDNPTLG
jgi:hypothetical protein